MSDFGGLIRDAREHLGLSPHRVAELIGRASGTIKAWERGRTVPHDPVVVTSLAAVLAIDETQLFLAAGLTPPGSPPQTTIEQELASIAPRPRPEPVPSTEREAERASVITDEQPAAEAETDTVVEEETAVDAIGAFLEKAVESIKQIPMPPFDRPAKPERRPRPRAVPYTPPVPTVTSAGGSYMEDAEERWSYRLRAIWTTAGIAGLGVALLWAGARMLEAFGDAWDALLAGL